jgi:biopolymer transport protein TolR
LVLLIIFMVTAPLISPSVIDVPSVGKAAAQPEQVIQVLIDAQEKIELKSTGSTSTQISVTLSSLPQQVMQLQGGNANTPVVISADKGIKYETVVKVMDSLQRAGVQRVGLSVQLQP